MAQEPKRIIDPAQHWTERAGQPIVAIVCHGTGGGLQSSLQTLKTGDGRGVSIHVLIAQDGTQYVMLPDDKGANHAGAASSSFTLNGTTYRGAAVNKATLGVELVSNQDGRDAYPEAQLRSLGWLINHWRSLHGPVPILRHADLDPTRRRDPYQLTTQQMEQAASSVSLPSAPLIKRYRVKRIMITQRQEDNGPPYVRELAPGEEVVVDKWYSNNRVHLADGSGFVDLADLEAV